MSDTNQGSSRLLGRLRSSLSAMGVAQAQSQQQIQVSQDENEKLELLDRVIESVEKESFVSAYDQDSAFSQEAEYDELNPPEAVGRGSKKESLSVSQPAEVPSTAYVEYEPNPEISPEVESFIHRVEESEFEHPHEVIIADGNVPEPAQHFPSKPVIVIPISQQDEAVAQKKDPTWSIKWLTEWSRKIIRIFVGKVIYQD